MHCCRWSQHQKRLRQQKGAGKAARERERVWLKNTPLKMKTDKGCSHRNNTTYCKSHLLCMETKHCWVFEHIGAQVHLHI